MVNASAEMMMMNGMMGVGINIEGCSYEEAKALAESMMATIQRQGCGSPLLKNAETPSAPTKPCGCSCSCEDDYDEDDYDDEESDVDAILEEIGEDGIDALEGCMDEDDYTRLSELLDIYPSINVRHYDYKDYVYAEMMELLMDNDFDDVEAESILDCLL